VNPKQFRIARWVYTGVLALALIAFTWRGVIPMDFGAYADMTAAEGHLFRAVTWTGFAVTLGFLMLPWWPWRGLKSD
jgi:hypothetical protein